MHTPQREVLEFCRQFNLETGALYHLLDLNSELGEVAKEYLQITSYGKEPLHKTDALQLELGDTFFALLCLANSLDIDLNAALHMAIDKYKKRMLLTNSPSSKLNITQ